MKRSLILFYSYEGNTEIVANLIAKFTGGKEIQIKPVNEMNKKGLAKYFWGGKDVLMGRMPKLNPLDIDLDDYEVIFIGSPIWAGTYAPPIKTLLFNEKLKNKKIIYFFTHEGGYKNAVSKFKNTVEPNNKLITSFEFLNVKDNREETEAKVEKYLEELKI